MAVKMYIDTDFGGVVDVKAALDASQIPPTPTFNSFNLNVGIGGTVPAGWPAVTERLATANTGTNNTIEGEIGALVTGGVVYE